MLAKRNILIAVLVTSCVVFIYCGRNKLKYNNAKELLLKTIYPQKVKANFYLYVRYESKEDYDYLNRQPWKKNNDILEKAGLLKQILIDTSIQYYIQSQARFEKRQHYLYKVILTPKIKNLMENSYFHSKQFDEYDYYNKHTGRKDWYSFEAVCGEFRLDTITNINQKSGPIDVVIEYKEKFFPTPFNDIADYGKKIYSNETFIRTVIAHKYPGEDWKLMY
jgi:hypothetical protein